MTPYLAADHLEPATAARVPACLADDRAPDTVRPSLPVVGDLVVLTLIGRVKGVTNAGGVLVEPVEIKGVRGPDTRIWGSWLEVERVDDVGRPRP